MEKKLPSSTSGTFQNDVFENFVDYVFEESSSEVDGKHIIGKIKGQFFVPDGSSRNNRFYSSALWNKVIANENFQSNLKTRTLFGTVSHEQQIDDAALRDGKVSHILTNLWIEGNKGMGEALILGTPAGQNLNTYLRAGSKLFVSSRANGRYAGYTPGNKIPCVDPDNYRFESFDFVKDPGFFEAVPNLVESVEDSETTNFSKEDTMEKDQLLESLIKERSKFEDDIRGALKQLEESNKKVKDLEASQQKMSEELLSAKEKINVLKAYEEIGEAQDIKYALKLAEGFGNKLKAVGNLDAVKSNMHLLESIKTSLEVPSLSEIMSKLASLIQENKSFAKFGTSEEIDKVFTLIEGKQEVFKFLNALDLKGLKANQILLETYKKSGTPEKIQEAFAKTAAFVKGIQESKQAETVKALASELQISEDHVAKLLKTMSSDEIKEMMTGMKKSASLKETYAKKPGTVVSPMSESSSNKNPFQVSRVSRLIKTHSGIPATSKRIPEPVLYE